MDPSVTTSITDRNATRPALSPMRATIGGATLGLAWSAGLRGWMAVLSDGNSSFTWLTFVALLLPATAVGAALGWAEHVRRTDGRGAWRWTALAPLLLVVMPALLQDDFVPQLLRTGIGGGAIAVVLIGMLGGYALSGRGPTWARVSARTIMAALVLAIVVAAFTVPVEGRPVATSPGGAYVVLTFLVFSGLLAAACAIPHLPAQHEVVAGDRRLHVARQAP